MKSKGRAARKSPTQSIAKTFKFNPFMTWAGLLATVVAVGLVGILLQSFAIRSTEIAETKVSSPKAVFVQEKNNLEDNIIAQSPPIELQSGSSEVLANLEDKTTFNSYRISADRDTVIIGPKGVKVKIPAGSFDSKPGDKVTIRLKEYLSKSDMLLSQLSTQTTSKKLLESGGMIYIEAMDVSGNQVDLKQGKQLELFFPKKEDKPGMQTFDGQKVNDNIIWKEQDSAEDEDQTYFPSSSTAVSFPRSASPWTAPARDDTYLIVGQMPSYPGGDKALAKFITSNTFYPRSALEAGIEGIVYVSFVVSSEGTTHGLKVLRGIDPALDSSALLTVMLMPHWTPGMQNGKKVSVRMNLPIRFFIRDKTGPSNYKVEVQGELIKQLDSLRENAKEEQIRWDKAYADNKAKIEQGDSLDESGLALYSRQSSYHILKTTNLGWINCDRYLRSGRTLVNATLNIEDPKMECKLIFKKINSVLAAWRNKHGDAMFPNVPVGEPVWVWVTKYENGKPYVAFKKASVSEDLGNLDFELMTQKKLDEIVALINEKKVPV